MGYIIEDGRGSVSKAEVSENRLRTFSVQDSLVNHQSTVHKQVYVVRSLFATGPSLKRILIIQNKDQNKLLVIDRVYVQLLARGSPVLAIDLIKLIVGNIGPSVPLRTITNENKSVIDILPNVIVSSGFGTDIGGPFNFAVEIGRLGDILELLPPNSDGIVLGFDKSMLVVMTGTSTNTRVEATARFFMIDSNKG